MTFFLTILLLNTTPIAKAVEQDSNPSATTFDTGSISSVNASYDGNALRLKGEVLLNHGLGSMKAEEAVLEKQEIGTEFPFSQIHLNHDVTLKLQNEAHLQCEKADLDFHTLKGRLSSSEKVFYHYLLKRKKGQTTEFQLKSQTIDLQFFKTGQIPQKSHYDIQNMVAHQDVQLVYDNDFILTTDAVQYEKEPSGLKSYFRSCGQQISKLVHFSDTIEADSFDLDILHSRLQMTKPHGLLASFSKGQIEFTSDTLVWDHEKNKLLLQGSSTVCEPSLGTFSSDQEVHLFQEAQKFSKLQSFGKTTLKDLNNHHLVSHGTLTFDRPLCLGTVESPLVNGVVPEELQLYYEEIEMTLLGDKAQIEYAEDNGIFRPTSIVLKDHIKIFSRSPDKPARRGLADRLTYNPTTRTFILGANPGKKVIFVNDEENMRISAQEVHITHDPKTKKQFVKGIGNVQLALTSEEELLLHKHFGKPHAPSTP